MDEARLTIDPTHIQRYTLEQHKHHRWLLDDRQIRQIRTYGLGCVGHRPRQPRLTIDELGAKASRSSMLLNSVGRRQNHSDPSLPR